MKKIILLSIFILFSCEQEKTKYVDLQENNVYLTKYKGKKLLVSFWATWCKSCIEEISYLEKNRSILEEKKIKILFVSNESKKEISNFVSRNNFHFEFIQYTGGLSELKIHTLPTTFIYNEKNELKRKVVGVLNIEKHLN